MIGGNKKRASGPSLHGWSGYPCRRSLPITDAGLHRAGQHDGQGEGPRRPQIITSTRISLPGSLREAVMPVDSPTVAKAEMVSNMILSNDCDSGEHQQEHRQHQHHSWYRR